MRVPAMAISVRGRAWPGIALRAAVRASRPWMRATAPASAAWPACSEAARPARTVAPVRATTRTSGSEGDELHGRLAAFAVGAHDCGSNRPSAPTWPRLGRASGDGMRTSTRTAPRSRGVTRRPGSRSRGRCRRAAAAASPSTACARAAARAAACAPHAARPTSAACHSAATTASRHGRSATNSTVACPRSPGEPAWSGRRPVAWPPASPEWRYGSTRECCVSAPNNSRTTSRLRSLPCNRLGLLPMGEERLGVDYERREDGAVVLRVSGRLEHTTAAVLEGVLRALSGEPSHVVLDLTAVDHIDSPASTSCWRRRRTPGRGGAGRSR